MTPVRADAAPKPAQEVLLPVFSTTRRKPVMPTEVAMHA
jgi:hypothetical protein